MSWLELQGSSDLQNIPMREEREERVGQFLVYQPPLFFKLVSVYLQGLNLHSSARVGQTCQSLWHEGHIEI